MQLIGGVLIDGRLGREVVLAPMTGEIELMLAEIAQADMAAPDKVTRFLAAAVAAVGGAPVEPEALSVPDRQHLVRGIGAALGGDLVWLTSRCGACEAGFDIPVRQSLLPVKPAGPDYPRRAVSVRGRPATLRAPTGADQAAVAHLPEQEALAALIDRLLDGTGPPAAELTEEEVAAIEAEVEAMMPETALEALARCPECGAENRVPVDPYLSITTAGGEIYGDVHVLACRYHWSEADILRLPRSRRKRYLALIDRERGMISAPDAPLE
jgi:hypothetical protein